MPELNIAASPSPTIVASAPAIADATPAGVAASTVAAGGNQTAKPFAAVLVQQIIRQSAAAGVGKAEDALVTGVSQTPADGTAGTDALRAEFLLALAGGTSTADALKPANPPAEGEEKKFPGQEDLAALIPVLLGVAAPVSGNGTASERQPQGAKPGVAEKANELLSTQLPTASAPSATTAAESLPPATSSAILAASPAPQVETTGTDKAFADKLGNFDAVLDAARNAVPAASTGHAAVAGASPAAPEVRVDTPVASHGWDTAVADKVVWMAGQQHGKADLVLNPPTMGRVEVSLTVAGDQAKAVFVSANPEVRQALEDAMPRLREVLQGAGINLGQTHVGADSAGSWASGGENGDNSFRGQTAGNDPVVGVSLGGSSSQWLRTGRGLVDTFA